MAGAEMTRQRLAGPGLQLPTFTASPATKVGDSREGLGIQKIGEQPPPRSKSRVADVWTARYLHYHRQRAAEILNVQSVGPAAAICTAEARIASLRTGLRPWLLLSSCHLPGLWPGGPMRPGKKNVLGKKWRNCRLTTQM